MRRFSRILCPVDFSDASEYAATHAGVLARWFGSSITALHVYAPMFMPVEGGPPPGDRIPGHEVQRAKAETVRWFAAAGAGRVDALVNVGHPAHEILACASSLPADLIVMGTHGMGGFERLVLGSVTEKVLRKAPCPVLVVPPRAHATSALPFKQVLCAVDFSAWSLAGLELAFEFAQASRAGITLMHVIEWPWDEPPAPPLQELPVAQADALGAFRASLEQSATARLDSLVPDSVRETCSVRVRTANGKTYTELLRAAADIGVDLIVIGVHGRNIADLTVFGSTTNQVVRRATCPVLTLRR